MALYEHERAKLQSTLGTTASIVAGCIARLHLASPDPRANPNDQDSVLRTFPKLSEHEWTNTNVQGALVFVIDRSIDTYVFQIYDLDTNELRFEYELYEDIRYEMLGGQFHAFEMEDCMAGFCFTDATEAARFLSKVMALRPSSKANDPINIVRGRGKGKKTRSSRKKAGGLFGWLNRGQSKKGLVTGKPTGGAMQIGPVVRVVHNAHVGVNADGTFDLNNIAPEWKSLFKKAGIKKKDLQNPERAAEIFNVIAETQLGQELQEELPDYAAAAPEDLKNYYTPEQMEQYEQYQRELEEYNRALAQYEEEQRQLDAMHKDLEDDFGGYDESSEVSAPSKSSDPPPLPARKKKEKKEKKAKRESKRRSSKRRSRRQEVHEEDIPGPPPEVEEEEVVVAAAEKPAAEKKEKRRSEKRRSKKNLSAELRARKEQEELERALKEKADAEAAALAAQKERDGLLAEIAKLQAQNAKNLEKLKKDQEAREALPVPPPAPKVEEKKPEPKPKKKAPPVPSKLKAPPLPSKMPEEPTPPTPPPLPSLPKSVKKNDAPAPGSLLAEMVQVKLKKAEESRDRSNPDPGFKQARPQSRVFLNAIEGGVNLKKVERPKSKLPNLKKMEPTAQQALISNLVAKLNERRKVFSQVSDDEDDWSDDE